MAAQFFLLFFSTGFHPDVYCRRGERTMAEIVLVLQYIWAQQKLQVIHNLVVRWECTDYIDLKVHPASYEQGQNLPAALGKYLARTVCFPPFFFLFYFEVTVYIYCSSFMILGNGILFWSPRLLIQMSLDFYPVCRIGHVLTLVQSPQPCSLNLINTGLFAICQYKNVHKYCYHRVIE